MTSYQVQLIKDDINILSKKLDDIKLQQQVLLKSISTLVKDIPVYLRDPNVYFSGTSNKTDKEIMEEYIKGENT